MNLCCWFMDRKLSNKCKLKKHPTLKYQLKQVFQLDTLPEQETRLTTHIRDGTDILGTIEIPLNQQMRHAIRNSQGIY